MEAIQACIEKSQELGLEVWLYDENGWPSGFADGKVPALGPAYQQKRLAYEWAPFTDGENVTLAYYVQSGEELLLLTPDDPCSPDFRVYYEVNPYYIDTLSKQAVKAFITTIYEAYWAHFGNEYGTVLKGIFTDEPQFGRGIFRGRWSWKKTLKPGLDIPCWKHFRHCFWRRRIVAGQDTIIGRVLPRCSRKPTPSRSERGAGSGGGLPPDMSWTSRRL